MAAEAGSTEQTPLKSGDLYTYKEQLCKYRTRRIWQGFPAIVAPRLQTCDLSAVASLCLVVSFSLQSDSCNSRRTPQLVVLFEQPSLQCYYGWCCSAWVS